MFRSILFFAFLVVASGACATPGAFSYSAARDEGQDWQYRSQLQHSRHRARIPRNNAQYLGVPLTKLDLSTVTAWKDYAEIEKNFKLVRDERFLEDPSSSHFLRRPTWMYPDDGCFARAHMMEERLELAGQSRVKKIFVFGNLNVKTSNAPGGKVTWWYHVAPIVSDGTDHYVMDPATEPARPLVLKDWLERMGKTKSFRIAICDSETYTPYEDCLAPANEASIAHDDQMYFMDPERDRLSDLGRNTEAELGDEPPWLRPVNITRP